jgi:hypothetical protein
LDPTTLDERLLNWMQLTVDSQPLDRLHLTTVGLDGEDQTRIDQPPIEIHRAGATLSLAAALLRAG